MSAEDYIQELVDERERLDPTLSAHSIRLLEDEINKVRSENVGYGSSPSKPEQYKEESIKLSEKIVLPVEEYPKFNFVGKIIGPKGTTLKSIVALTKTKISVLGRGSTRDREKEEELSRGDDPKHEHFKEPLHVLIQVEAPRSEAHRRLADAMEEINKSMSPENGDMRNLPYNIADAIAQQFPSAHGLQAPIIRVGIPPPGAFVLNEQPRGRGTKLGVARAGGDRQRFRTSQPY